MKMLLILILAGALVAGAALSRPTESDFAKWYTEQVRQQKTNFFAKIFRDMRIDGYLKECNYKNRVLWAEVEKDGKVVYTGAFGHWFSSADVASVTSVTSRK